MIENTDGRVKVDLRRVPYDVEALLAILRASDMPHCSWWIDSFNAC